MLASQNRVFKYLGYDTVHYFENAPEYDAARPAAAQA
jgi:hypothetical protein